MKDKILNITKNDIKNGEPTFVCDCPAALALRRLVKENRKTVYIYHSFGYFNGRILGDTPDDLFKWIWDYDQNPQFAKPAKFKIQIDE